MILSQKRRLHWEFTNLGTPVLRGGQVGPNLTLTSGDQTSTATITSKSSYTAHKTLGHYKDPDGNQTKQYKMMKEKSDKAAIFVTTSPLTHRDTWTYYYAIYLTSVGYPLAGCHFTFQQLDAIQRKALRAIIGKCGFNRNTKRLIIYGPTSLGGCSFRHLATEQGLGQIQTCLKFSRTDSQPGRMLRIALAWVQLAAGTSVSLLTDVKTPLPHCESKWFLSLRTYLNKIDGHLELGFPTVPPPQRVKDQYIMDIVLSSKKFKPEAIQLVNYCRLYLQAVTIADIAEANGTHLDPALLRGSPSLLSSMTTLLWINQERPSEKAWGCWRRACQLFSTRNGTLFEPLGMWLYPHKRLRREWKALYHEPSHRLFIRTQKEVQVWVPLDGKYHLQPWTRRIPNNARPATICDTINGWQLSGPTFRKYYELVPLPPSSFQEYLQTCDPWESTLFHSLEMKSDPFTIAKRLQTDVFLGVSDGSVRFQKEGSFGWVIALSDGT